MSTLETDLDCVHSDDIKPIGTLHGVAVYTIDRESANNRAAAYRKQIIAQGNASRAAVTEGD